MSELKPTLERLYALIPRGRMLGLERMMAACARFGNPERAFEIFVLDRPVDSPD